MSIKTDADMALANALTGIKTAIQSLGSIVIGECWGHEQYKRELLFSALSDLMAIREKLE